MTRSRVAQLAAAIAGLGISFRLAEYLARASLWGDEVMLALNIARRSWPGLLQPLDYAQLAPVPFLLLERAIVHLFGAGELAFRAPPLLAGCATLVLLWAVARRLLSPPAALLALALAASSTWLIRYAAELKPYAIDALIATALAAAGLRVREQMRAPARWALLIGIGIVGVVASAPAVMVAAAVLAGLAWEAVVRRDRTAAALCFGAAAIWAAAFLPVYLRWFRPVSLTPYMQSYWEAAFLAPGPFPLLPRLWVAVQDMLGLACDWMVELSLTIPALVFVAAGTWRIGRERGASAAIMLLGPVVAAFAASAAGRFPIAARLMLFAAPLLVVALAGGMAWAVEVLHRLAPTARRPVLLAGLALPSMGIATRYALMSPSSEEVRPLAAEFIRSRQPGEAIYVAARVIPAWTFYTTDWARPDTTRLDRIARAAGPEGPAFGNAARVANGSAADADADLWWPARGELLGRASGMQGRQWVGYVPETPAPGWADAEAGRIRTVAAPTAWIVLLHPELPESAELLAAVARAGGRADRQVTRGEATLYRVRFT